MGSSRFLWCGLGALMIAFHLSLIFVGLVPNLLTRPVHMAFALPWILILAAKPGFEKITGIVLCAAGVLACLYIAANESLLGDQYGSISGPLQLSIAIILVIVVLETARRAIGWPLPMVASLALAYGVLGEYLPGEFGHPGFPLTSFLGSLTIAEGGLWGQLTGVSVSIISIFVIFGAVLNAGEAGQGFMNLATAAAGRLKGGAAKVSVLSSALFGSISGSASANVASTGAITLPAMTKLGYPRTLAGAVEAVASSGGQIMPPLMGAGAFVMVELTGVPYTGIMAAAFLPAILYFTAVWFGINAYATRYDLLPLSGADQPRGREVLITSLFFAIPFSILMERMFLGGFTPQYAASVAILVALLMLFFDRKLTFSFSRSISRLDGVCLAAGKQMAIIASIILCASLIVGVLGMTGLGVKITSLILSLSGDQLWPALLLTGFACLILGMEVPTTAAYVICVSVAGPALQKLGLEPLMAHLFVFWFALLSTITPPVCGAVFIAAGMVEENWLKVALTAMALGVGLYVIPLAMVANPALIAPANGLALAFFSFAKVGVGLVLISFGLIGRYALWRRGAMIGAGLASIFVMAIPI